MSQPADQPPDFRGFPQPFLTFGFEIKLVHLRSFVYFIHFIIHPIVPYYTRICNLTEVFK
jgi:hypothetical protein